MRERCRPPRATPRSSTGNVALQRQTPEPPPPAGTAPWTGSHTNASAATTTCAAGHPDRPFDRPLGGVPAASSSHRYVGRTPTAESDARSSFGGDSVGAVDVDACLSTRRGSDARAHRVGGGRTALSSTCSLPWQSGSPTRATRATPFVAMGVRHLAVKRGARSSSSCRSRSWTAEPPCQAAFAQALSSTCRTISPGDAPRTTPAGLVESFERGCESVVR